VIVSEIKIENFRCYEFAEIPINGLITLIHGENGSGKSSIIEAINFAVSGKSFRTSDQNVIIKKGEDLAQTFITFNNGNGIKITKKKNQRSKILQSKDKKLLNYADLVTNYPTCLVENKEFFFTTSTPEQKRAYLNKTLFYVEQNIKTLLNELKKIIYQRAACLKKRDQNQLIYWDQKLVEIEPIITKTNTNIIKMINDMLEKSSIRKHFEEKNPWLADLRIKYTKGYEDIDDFHEILQRNHEKDMILKRTSAGPHKRSFNLLINDTEAHEILSRGQQKVVSIILHLIQRELVCLNTELYPIVLMDDISSELDDDNANLMLKYLIDNSIQTIMTSIENKRFLNNKDVIMFHVEQKGDKSNVRG
tara:strand:+ start:2464 stop:3552 length:1089 start_codon:yes stop_codon:yes gene_type:complete